MRKLFPGSGGCFRRWPGWGAEAVPAAPSAEAGVASRYARDSETRSSSHYPALEIDVRLEERGKLWSKKGVQPHLLKL
ncbi:hypothetical protein GRJ2_002315400 [Grus japonensis]|uniref:Uncharacterized protein n=1 Tax=Grus japonensis TaxID=30415 RepID=A0ABC9XLC9_GRUJA